MKESVGLLIVHDNKILACKPFGNKGLDIPKGLIELNESRPQCMVREVWEETGISVNYLDYWEEFEVCGEFQYLKDKILFLYKVEMNIDISKCKCNSYFDFKGKQVPEVVGYEWVSFDELDKFYKSLQPILRKCLLGENK